MKKNIYILLLIYIIFATLSIIFFNGTGGAGDSISHYLYAKYAPVHIELFFHHWAKPLFVLLSSPFAQFGFIGIKIFNAITVLVTIFFTYKIAKELKFKNPIIVAIILIFTPVYFILGLSGLTEPLFAMVLAISIYFIAKKKTLIACIIISFTPFIRTEGYLFLLMFATYLLFQKRWKFIPLLTVGNIIYSICGYFIYNNLLWVFTKIPYVASGNKYGEGDMFHFVNQLYYIVGIPLFILFWLGVISIIYRTAKKKIGLEELLLIFLSFSGFFVAHSLFWYIGIFDSMGLSRVLLSVVPLIALIMLQGYNLISEEIFTRKSKIKTIIQCLFVLYIIIFPFTSNPAAINWEKDFNLNKDQQLAIEVTNFIKDNKLTANKFYYSHPYLSETLNIDHFDASKRVDLRKSSLKNLKSNEIIIWENWFSVVECSVTEEYLLNMKNLKKIKSFNTTDNGREIIYIIFETI